MKKAGIITHYEVHNHGAVLQLYGLVQVLAQSGYEAKALQFQKNYDFFDKGSDAKYHISVKSIPYYIKYLCKHGIGRTSYNVKKRKILTQFREDNQLIGEQYAHAKNLDAVVIGSDEIFSVEPGLNPCFWGMGVPCKKVISYAASFGPTDMDFLEKHQAVEFVRAGIQHIQRISVRDGHSAQMIHQLSNQDAVIVCDPVILYGFAKEQLKNQTDMPKTVQKLPPFLLVYAYDNRMNDADEVTSILAFARKKGWKVYSVGYYHKWCDRNIQLDPLEMFAYFQKAEMVVTDTFHGAVISLVTNRPFAVKMRGNQNKLGFLLKEYHCEDRILQSFDELEEIDKKPMHYKDINETIEQRRHVSMAYLQKAL